ncbi:MAG: ribonuclease HII [Candidatus Woesearchaeota archaeon]
MKLVAGIDEAGRGPVIGPLGLAIVACEEPVRQLLSKSGVRDSKVLSVKKRLDLARLIRKSCFHAYTLIPPGKIDASMLDEDSSLTVLEANESAKLIARIAKKLSRKETLSRIIIDLPSRNKSSYIAAIRSCLPSSLKQLEIIAEHRADENHVQVSAASILAKVARDSAIRSFEKNHGVGLGSGYPSDPNTKTALRNHFDLLESESFLRMQWATVKALQQEKLQSSLSDFYNEPSS